MAKSIKGKTESSKSALKESKEANKKVSTKPAKQLEEDDEDEVDDEETTKAAKVGKASSKKGKEDDDEEEDAEEAVDDWDKPEEEESWDPDFEEFDLPKSKVKKATGGAGKKGKEEEDLGVDEEFKDMDLFNDSGFDDEEDDF